MTSTRSRISVSAVLNSGVGIVPVVENQQVDAYCRRRLLQTLAYGIGKGHLQTLTGEAETELMRPCHMAVVPVGSLRHVTSMHQRLQNAVNRCFGDFCAFVDRLQDQGLVLILQELQDVQCFGEHRNQVQTMLLGVRPDLRFRGHLHLSIIPDYDVAETVNSLMVFDSHFTVGIWTQA